MSNLITSPMISKNVWSSASSIKRSEWSSGMESILNGWFKNFGMTGAWKGEIDKNN